MLERYSRFVTRSVKTTYTAAGCSAELGDGEAELAQILGGADVAEATQALAVDRVDVHPGACAVGPARTAGPPGGGVKKACGYATRFVTSTR